VLLRETRLASAIRSATGTGLRLSGGGGGLRHLLRGGRGAAVATAASRDCGIRQSQEGCKTQ